jgi:hypothetical protein
MQYTTPEGFEIFRPDLMIRIQAPVRGLREEAERDLPQVQSLVEQEKAWCRCLVRSETVSVHEDIETGKASAFGRLRFWPPEATQADVNRLAKPKFGLAFLPWVKQVHEAAPDTSPTFPPEGVGAPGATSEPV